MPIYQLPLIAHKTVARQTIEYIFEKPANFNFIPGQYGGFTLINKETNTPATRRFSLLSTPHESVIRIATRIQPSPFKDALIALQSGDTIKFAGPTGAFTLHEDISIPAIFIAGGIGITPFYSMINHEKIAQSQRLITLFYGNKTAHDAAYFDEFLQYANQNAAFTFIPVLQDPEPNWHGEKGVITASLIDNCIDCNQKAIFYVCGSPAMVQAIQRALIELDIPADNIKSEDFPGY